MTKKFLAEFIGTFTLVLLGCGSAVLAGTDHVGQLGIALAFGLAIVAMAYGIGPISGCHVNPAVSFGAYIAGRISDKDLGLYVVAQVLGALVGLLKLVNQNRRVLAVPTPVVAAAHCRPAGACGDCPAPISAA